MNFNKYILLFCLLVFNLKLFSQSLSDSLIAHYPFDGNPLDVSGNGNHGSLFGPIAVADRFGNSNGAYKFNGTSDYIHYISNAKFKPATFPFSISMWVKSNDNSIIGTLFKNDVVVDIYTGIWIQIHASTGKIEISYGDGGTTDAAHRKTKLGNKNVNDNQWHFIAAVIRSPNDMDIWVDCQYDNGAYSGNGGNISYSNNGGSSGYYDVVAGTEYYGGFIDDIRFYNRELTQTDLEALYIYPQAYINPSIQNFELGNDTNLCSVSSVLLNANVAFPGIIYNWSNGSNQSSITANSAGIYWLQISDNCNSKIDTISVSNSNINITTSNDTTICVGNSVTLMVSGNSNNFVWTNNGINYFGNTLTISPWTSSVYYVYANDSLCPSATDSVIVTVSNISPNSNFTASSILCENNNCLFSNNSSLGLNYLWNFGDPSSGLSNTSIDINGNHIYAQAGIYNVTLIAYGVCGIDSTSLSISVINAPTTIASADQTICDGQQTILMATGGNYYAWSNDASITNDSVSVFPNTNTNYFVQAIVNGCYGLPDTIQITVKPYPVVQIVASPYTCNKLPIVLTAYGNATNYQWTGGYISNNDTVVFVPSSNTEYILIGTTGICVATDTFLLSNLTETEAIFDYELDSCSGKIILNNSSSGGYNYLWRFNDSESVLQNPVFQIDNAIEEQTIQLIVNPNTACADTTLSIVNINDLENFNFFIPNTFTPNDDNLNDLFTIRGNHNCSPITIYIYNRWGECIFKETSNKISWDGKYKNKEVPEGVYFYIIERADKEYSGALTLLR